LKWILMPKEAFLVKIDTGSSLELSKNL
jgi:hypothetical protein